MKKLFSLVLTFAILSGTLSINCLASNVTSNSNDIEYMENFKENTRERFVAAMALEKGISYEEADRLEQESSPIVVQAADEKVKYKTVNIPARAISGGSNYSKTVYIAAEVRYVYSYELGRNVTIEDIYAPYAYIPGISADNITFDHGNYDIQHDNTSGVITVIGSFVYSDSGVDVSVGGDVVSVSKNYGSYTITTGVVTLKAPINIRNLPWQDGCNKHLGNNITIISPVSSIVTGLLPIFLDIDTKYLIAWEILPPYSDCI